MKAMMDANAVMARARNFLYHNARLLDRKRYEALFEQGSKRAVIEALRAYQNEDGGFGHALEPDIRCPYSQPVPTEMALSIMEEIDHYDPDILDGIIRYLRTIALPTGGFPRLFRSAGEFPHAPWWKTERDDEPSVNPTGLIIGHLYNQTIRSDIYGEDWFIKTVDYLWSVMEKEWPNDFHEAVQWLKFLQHTPDQDRAKPHLARLDEWLGKPGTIELDPHAQGYVHKVLDWAPLRDSYAGKFVSEQDLHRHLQALLAEQQEDGGWPISWQPPSPAAVYEWRGSMTVERLKTLRSYGMLD